MSERRLIPIYTTTGDVGAFMIFPYLFNRQGEWVGWVTKDKEVYSVHGRFVGFLGEGPRILRKRSQDRGKPQMSPPPMPPKIRVPSSVPLPPMMPELPFHEVDILDDEPERLPTLDHGELREDMD